MTVIQGTRMPHYPDGKPYVYEASPEEDAAAAMLREKGWHVNPPPCPDCHGAGHVNFRFVGETGKGTRKDPIRYETTWDPCPRGCPTPALIL